MAVSENKYFLFVSFNNFSVSFSLFIVRSFGCVLHLCRGTPDHDFCAVNKQLYQGDSHALAPSFNTLFLCPFCFDLLFMHCNSRVVSQSMWYLWWTKCHGDWIFFKYVGYSISAPYSLFHQLSVLYNPINWQCCWITRLKKQNNPTMPPWLSSYFSPVILYNYDTVTIHLTYCPDMCS